MARPVPPCCSGAARRRLAIWFLVIAATALLTAVSVQYQGFVVANGGRPPWPRLADLADWTRPVMAGVLAALGAVGAPAQSVA